MDERQREKRQWETLHGRIEWVIENKRALVVSESAWSEKAGLTRQHVSTLKDRSKKAAASGKVRKFDFQTAAALARVAEVSVPWFGEGKGRPDDLPDATGRYPWIQTLRDSAKEAGVESWYVRDFESFLATEKDEFKYDQAYRMLVDRWNVRQGGEGRATPEKAAEIAQEIGKRPSGAPPKRRPRGAEGRHK